MLKPKDIDVLILCGGFGKRLRSVVDDRPKPMAEVKHQPFMDLLIKYMSSFGFRHFILSIGYMANKMMEYYAQKKHLEIVFSEEKSPLGTGGAIKNARPLIKSNPFLVINGDSFCRINLREFLRYHEKNNAFVSMVVARNRENKDCGMVKLDNFNRISNFNEKAACKNNTLVSAGIYLFQKEIISLMPEKAKFSLEYDLFPKLTEQGFYGFFTDNTLIDIGTPHGLKRAESYFKRFKG